jgi:hypothetical protein
MEPMDQGVFALSLSVLYIYETSYEQWLELPSNARTGICCVGNMVRIF